MTCRYADRILDLADPREADLELQAHVGVCPSCRLELRILQEARPAFYPEFNVPQHLVERVIGQVESASQTTSHAARPVDVWAGAGPGASTALAAVIATGSVGPRTGVIELVALALVCGALAAWGQVRILQPERSATA